MARAKAKAGSSTRAKASAKPEDVVDSKPADEAKAKRPERAGNPNITFRGTPEYRQWLNDHAKLARCDAADLIDRGLALLAQQHGWPAPPKRTSRGGG